MSLRLCDLHLSTGPSVSILLEGSSDEKQTCCLGSRIKRVGSVDLGIGVSWSVLLVFSYGIGYSCIPYLNRIAQHMLPFYTSVVSIGTLANCIRFALVGQPNGNAVTIL